MLSVILNLEDLFVSKKCARFSDKLAEAGTTFLGEKSITSVKQQTEKWKKSLPRYLISNV